MLIKIKFTLDFLFGVGYNDMALGEMAELV